MLFGVRGRVWLLFVSLLGCLEGPKRLCYGRFAGFQGCKFSSSVCLSDETCVDDRLFGNCQKSDRPTDGYQYFLDRGTLQSLEAEIYRLIKDGYSWENLYTQCVLGNILVAFRRGIPHDETWCDKQDTGFIQSPASKLDEDTLGQLERYFTDYYFSNPTSPSSESSQDKGDMPFVDSSNDAGPSSYLNKKAEEYLKIHKYVPPSDKRMASLSSPSSADEAGGPRDYSYYNGDNSDAQDSYYQKLLNGFSTNDLQALKDYLQDEESLVSQDYPDYSVDLKDAQLDPNYGGYVWSSEQPGADASLDVLLKNKQKTAKSPDQKPAVHSPPIADEMAADTTDSQNDDKNNAMSPEEAKLLGDLLEDNIPVTSLSDKQIKRLSQHVEKMLTAMQRDQAKGRTDTASRHGNGNMAAQQQTDDIVKAVEKTVQEGISKGDIKPSSSKKAVTKEQLNTVLLKSSGVHNDAKITVKKANVHDSSSDRQMKALNNEKSSSLDEAVVTQSVSTETNHYKEIHTEYANLQLAVPLSSLAEARGIVRKLEQHMHLPPRSFLNIRYEGPFITFRVDVFNTTASQVAKQIDSNRAAFSSVLGVIIKSAGIGDKAKITVSEHDINSPKYILLTFVLCGCIAGVVISVIAIYLIKRHLRSRKKLEKLTATGENSQVTQDYQDLCRQRMQSKASEKPEPLSAASRVGSTSESAVRSPSSRSSTSSWSEEPASSNMDISTGHIVLSYMEDHLKNKDRLDREWESLCAYEAEPCSTKIGNDSKNMRKNRYSDIVPYDHSRVVLSVTYNVSSSDYVNASSITDHDPRNPAYIATQGPLPHTVADFWQMVWEQGSVVIVSLTKLTENGVAMCHRYWPEEGSELYHIYEVHLVSEHIWCDDYLVRSFYLKNLQTNETRTVTQFHFLSWPDLGVPASIKALLDFRRKVNKSYRGRSCPIVLHCSDGAGRTGTYCLIDMVLNRMSKGAKEIDIAATLEHIRDQRMAMAKTKEQFEFALAAVAEEVHAILKALPQ